MEAETAPAETYPWDQAEPYIPPLQASLIVIPATPLSIFDHEGTSTVRVVGLRIGDLTLHTGLSGGDTEVIEVIDRLMAALGELRENAERRVSGEMVAVR